MGKLRVVITTMLLFANAPAFAASGPSPAVRQACMDDARRFCSSVLFQPEKRRDCMRAHRMQLSERCRTAAIEDRMQRMQKAGGN